VDRRAPAGAPAGGIVTGPQDVVAALAARAALMRTTWAGGAMVWRAWGDGPPLVVLHGASGAWTHWIRNIPTLATRFRVLAPDMPGFGDSDTIDEPHTAEALADLVADAVEQVVPPPAPLSIAGFSFGSIVGGLVAARLRRRVRTLVFIGAGGTGLPFSRTPPLLRLDPGATAEAAHAVHRENLARLMMGDPAAVDEVAVHVQMENVRRARFRSGTIPVSDALLKALPAITARLGGAIWGGRDAFMGPAYVRDCGRLLASFWPGVDVRVVQGAGHWVIYEAAETVNAVLVEMLVDADAGGRG
jgi:pimeloyl-ACP methyl ester carboxylesterase